MDTKTTLIIFKGNDRTKAIETIRFDSHSNMWQVRFAGSEQVYHCNASSVIEYHEPKHLDSTEYRFQYKGKPLYKIVEVIRFGHYYRFFFENGTERLLEEAELEIRRNCLLDGQSKDCMGYFRAVSDAVSLKGEDGISLLGRQLEKIQFVSDKTVLASYLNPTSHPLRSYDKGPLIFPFGCNESQKKAVEAALCSQLTLIEGPPGTGKTQTILNLIANLMIRGKRIAVVSNNNSATENVYEKLDKHDLAFLCAVLGNADNKQRFIENQTKYEVRKPEMLEEEWFEILETADGMQKKLSEYLVWKNKLAQLETDYNSILLEQTHFQNYMEETFRKEKKIDITLRLSSTQVLVLKMSLEAYAEKYGREELSWIQKLRLFLFYRIRNREFLSYSLDEILTEFERQFYDLKRKELEEEQDQIQAKLDHFRYEDKKLEMEQLSMVVLKEKIAQYYSKHRRLVFDRDDIWKNPEKILACYPIVLSTTHSICNSLPGVMYDYLIVDEASQVDLLTGVLALSCAENVVVVGDEKQLPNVITEKDLKKIEGIDQRFQVSHGLRYGQHSLLSSIRTVFPEVPHVILREHYRCHPRIIQFCNKKFYHDQLIIMTKDGQEQDVLKVYKTVAGNHARGRVNQRQIDEITHTVLPELFEHQISEADIGIISPYRDQTEAVQTAVEGKLTVDTVHKFQGREKEAIIITTVDNEITEFADNPNLLNVAVSRAVKKLRLLISDNEKNDNTNIGDLVRYIAYEKGEVVSGKVYSVFDLLYKDYRKVREAYLKNKRRVSEVESENLFYHYLQEFLEREGYVDLDIAVHMPLRMIIKDVEGFDEEEVRFAMHRSTHVDFLIYKKIDKQPVLAIEVDGEQYHRKGSYQREVRDACKDRIFSKSGLKLLRLSTVGSMEDERLREAFSSVT